MSSKIHLGICTHGQPLKAQWLQYVTISLKLVEATLYFPRTVHLRVSYDSQGKQGALCYKPEGRGIEYR
jgi:hypothetical protein